MPFVHIGRSQYVPLSEVVRAEADGMDVKITLRSGEIERTTQGEWDEALSLDFVSAVPCPPGMVALESVEDEIHREPVFGLAINRKGEALPITAQGVSVHRRQILMPDGRVVEHDAFMDTLEVWQRTQR